MAEHQFQLGWIGGEILNLPPLIQQLDQKLEGLPDQTLTVILIVLGLFAIMVALYARPVFKAALAAWFIAP